MNAAQHAVAYLAPLQITPDPDQPRKHIDADALATLTDSVRAKGVVQPILVRTAGAKFLIIAGERRWRAAVAAELDALPAIVRDDLAPAEILATQIAENLQRKDLTLQETIDAVARLVDLSTVADAARNLGMKRSWVSRISGVRRLWQRAQDLVQDGHLHSVDAAHDLSALHEVDPAVADRLAGEFTQPPAYRATPPTRELIRSELDMARQRATERQSLAREQQETNELRREQQAQRDPVDTATALQASAPATAPHTPVRDAMQELRAACQRRAATAVSTALTPLMHALRLRQGPDGCTVDADGQVRVLDLQPPLPSIHADADELRAFDPTQQLWRLEMDLSHDDLQRLISAFNGSSALPPRIQSVARFLSERTRHCPGERIASDWLFAEYSQWCRRNALSAVENANEFATAMEIHGAARKRFTAGRFWIDLQPTQN